jgi:hypothetical protein
MPQRPGGTTYIKDSYKELVTRQFKDNLFNALKGDADPDNEREKIVVPEGFTVQNGVVSGSPTITRIDPLEPLEAMAEALADVIDRYVTERIKVEIVGYGVEDAQGMKITVEPGTNMARKLKYVADDQ